MEGGRPETKMIVNSIPREESLARDITLLDNTPVTVINKSPVQEKKKIDYGEEILLSIHAGEPILHWVRFAGEYEKVNRCVFCGKNHEIMVPMSNNSILCSPCHKILSSNFTFITEKQAQAYYITY